MPLLRRQPFTKEKPPADLKPDEEVFYCPLTEEIFRDYEEFFERIILCNSLVWTCSITGRPGLTYQEALESEEKARKHLSTFPKYLQKPVLYLATLTHRSRLNDMNDDVFVFMKDRFFVGETVEVINDGEKKNCKILEVVQPDKNAGKDSDDEGSCIVLDDSTDSEDEPLSKIANASFISPGKYQYVVQVDGTNNILVVDAEDVNRKKGLYTRDKSKLFLKQHGEVTPEGIWKIKDRFIKKFKVPECNFSDYFPVTPTFQTTVAKKKPASKSSTSKDDDIIKKHKKEKKEKKSKENKEKESKKKEKKGTKQVNKPIPEPVKKLTPEEREALKEKFRLEKEKQRQEALAVKAAMKEELKKKWEEEKLKRKEERDKEREKKREEMKVKAQHMREWNRPREDLQCEDLKDMPVSIPVQTRIPNELFGEAMMILEFIHVFGNLFDAKTNLPDGLTIEDLGEALMEKDSTGPLCDLLFFLLTTIFDLQTEEEAEEKEIGKNAGTDEMADHENISELSHEALVNAATVASQWPQLYHGASLKKLSLDSFTLTEILRLHFLSSGARGKAEDAKFRYQQRGGYTSLDDPGLEFRMSEPEIIKALSTDNVFDILPEDKLKIIHALMNQLLTYAASRDFMEDNFEKFREDTQKLKNIRWDEQRRQRDEAAARYRKKMEEKAKQREKDMARKEQIRKEREERLKQDEMKAAGLVNGETTPMETDAEASKEKENPETKEEERPRRKGLRGTDEKDIPLEDIDEDKLTEEQKEELKRRQEEEERKQEEEETYIREEFLKREKELCETLMQLQHGNAITPLGRDRVYRRYWMFRCMPGIFVEDNEEDVPDDEFQVIEQVQDSTPFKSDNLPLDVSKANTSSTAEDKSTTSDKENESFDGSSRTNHQVAAPGNPGKTLSAGSVNINAANNDAQGVKPPAAESPVKMETQEGETKDQNDVVMETVHKALESRNETRWAFYSKPEDIENLIGSLNPRGYREKDLRQSLMENKALILRKIPRCPIKRLHLPKEEIDIANNQSESKAKFQELKSRNRVIKGMVKSDNAAEYLELNLRETILDMEERIYAGSLGKLKVKERIAWRDALENGSYSQQCDSLLWSTCKDQPGTPKKGGKKGSTDNIDDERMSESSGDDAMPMVRDLAKAVLQVGQMIDSKYMVPPLGDAEVDAKKGKKGGARKDTKGGKKKEEEAAPMEEEEESASSSKAKKTAFERWEESLMSTTSVSGLFLHINTLDNSIAWSKSTLEARCKICRKKSDAEKMLLCDECDRGFHMYCLKPKVRNIPKGQWFCLECKPKEVQVHSPRKGKRKKFSIDEDEDDEEEEDDDDTEELESDSSEEEEDVESEEEGSEEESADDESSESEEEEVIIAPKIKLLRGMKGGKKSQPSSGRSTPSSMKGSGKEGKTSKNNSPADGRNSRGGKRKNEPLNSSMEKPSKSRKIVDSPEELEPEKKKATTKSRGNEESNKMTLVEDLVDEMTRHDDAWPFLRPVSKRDAPDYYDLIKEPMDLQTMRNKLNKFEYTQVIEIIDDVRLIFRNCLKYNMPHAEEYKLAQKLGKLFEKRVRELGLEESASKVTPKGKGKSTPKAADVMKVAEELLADLYQHQFSWPFVRPVSKRDAPDYYDLIKEPMDFQTMRNKVHKFEYKNHAQILSDVRLVFKNCKTYNQPGSEERQLGEKLSKYFEKKVKEMKLDQAVKGNSPGTTPTGSGSSGRRSRRT